MRHITSSATFAAIIFAGSAVADNTFPCSKAQFWITSMPTVPAAAEAHRDSHQINIAATVLQPRIRDAKETYQQVVASK